MILAAIIVLFGVLILGTLLVLASRLPDDEVPHPPKCDCMTCGRRAAEKHLKRRIGKRGW